MEKKKKNKTQTYLFSKFIQVVQKVFYRFPLENKAKC